MKSFNPDEIREIPLKNSWLAAFLAWLCPGLGHFYQGRTAKGVIFFCTITPLIAAGLWMGSYWEGGAASGNAPAAARRLAFAKNAYCQWEPGNRRLYFIPQALNASIAVPALLQASAVRDGAPPLWNGAFAPPASAAYSSPGPVPGRPTLNAILYHLDSWFEMGTIFLAAAGLLNLLVIFDALFGPAWIIPDEVKDELVSGGPKKDISQLG